MTYKQREQRVMIFAQVEFLWLLLAGLLLVSVGAVILTIPASDASCATVTGFLCLGYTLELVPLIIKVAAINCLMQAARHLKRVVLRRQSLFGVVFLLSGLVVVGLSLWTALDPKQKSAEYKLTDQVTRNNETVVTVSYFCQSDSVVWRYVAVAWNCLLLIGATVLAFQTCKLQEDFNESQTLAIMIDSHFVFVILRLITFFLENTVSGSTLARFRSLISSCNAVATIVIYFVPKFMPEDGPTPWQINHMLTMRVRRFMSSIQASHAEIEGDSPDPGTSRHGQSSRMADDEFKCRMMRVPSPRILVPARIHTSVNTAESRGWKHYRASLSLWSKPPRLRLDYATSYFYFTSYAFSFFC